ncbi:MAG: UDP-4-amino-4,6-dideoxy-N-acetyl-beta-L-altrosamine transaminase [Inquilinus sp.]|nr:UDP-4-amino-4,6-dideoxy-N-acetyl-beta-L-altrosamine transaminase [Inquilinus sp.]
MPDAPFPAAAPPLPYARHWVDDDDVAAVCGVLRGDFLTSGPVIPRLEAALAERFGVGHVVACASGTAALHLAALAFGLGPGDSAVVPAMTFLATANAVRLTGAEVRFADVDPETGLMRPQDLASALAREDGPPAKALFPVHLNGQSCDMAELAAIARKHGLKAAEDGCHALGGWQGEADGGLAPVGACRSSDAACFSLPPAKAIAAGEGGAVATDDPELAERLARLRNHGMTRDPTRFEQSELACSEATKTANPWYYEMPEVGPNYRLSDIHAALALSQLSKLGRFLKRRRALADAYESALAPLAPLVRPIGRVAGGRHAWHLYAVHVDFAAAGIDRAALMARLAARGIGSQVHYIPVHRQPYYRRRYGEIALPGAEAYYAGCLSLPLFPKMADGDVARVAEALAEALGAKP